MYFLSLFFLLINFFFQLFFECVFQLLLSTLITGSVKLQDHYSGGKIWARIAQQ